MNSRYRLRAIIVLALTITVAAIVCTVWLDIPFASHDLDREWARAQKNGYPLLAADLKPKPPVRDDENAAPLLRKAIALVDRELLAELVVLDVSPKSGGLTPEKRDKAVERAKPALDVLQLAVKKPNLWMDKDYDAGYAEDYPEFRTFKALAKALAARADQKARRGVAAGAISDLRTGRRLAALVASQPTLLAEFVGMAIDQIMNVAVEHVAAFASRNAKTLATLRKGAVEDIPLNIDQRVGLRGEIYMELATMRNFNRYRRDSPNGGFHLDRSKPILRSGSPPSMTIRAWLARGMRAWNDLLESPEWKNGDPIAIGELTTRIESRYWETGKHKLSYALWAIVFPSYSQAGKAVVQASVRRTTLASLLKVLEFRAAHGAFPKTLADAGADAPDPFAPKAQLHYKTNASTAKVWSVGTNGKDDGGESKNQKDVVASFPPSR